MPDEVVDGRQAGRVLLVINAGSSSIKFFDWNQLLAEARTEGDRLQRVASGVVQVQS